jgi:hypothetical protein
MPTEILKRRINLDSGKINKTLLYQKHRERKYGNGSLSRTHLAYLL